MIAKVSQAAGDYRKGDTVLVTAQWKLYNGLTLPYQGLLFKLPVDGAQRV